MYSNIRPSKIQSILRLRYVDRLGPGSRGNRRVSGRELKLRLRFHRYMREKKSKIGETVSDSSIIQDDWIDWMIMWKSAVNNMDKNYLGIQQEPSDHAVVLLKQTFSGRTSLVCVKRKELSREDAAIIIQTSYRARLRRNSQVLQDLRDLTTANTRLKKIRGFFNDYSYRSRLREDAEERQRFREKIIVLLLNTDSIWGANAKIRVAQRLMVDEMLAMLDKIDVISVARTEGKNFSDHEGVLLRRAFSSRVGKKRDVLSPMDAAIKIQTSFWAYLRRQSQVLRSQKELEVAKTKLKEMRDLFNHIPYRRSFAQDAQESQRFAEKMIVLILTVDVIEGADVMIRLSKKTVLDELEAMLDVVQPVKLNVEPMIDMIDTNFMAELENICHRAVILRGAFFRRKGRRKELWPVDAAIKIQRCFRAHMKKALQSQWEELAMAETKLKEISGLFNDSAYRLCLGRDAEERQRFVEKIIVLLLNVDVIEDANVMIRGSKKTMLDELEGILDVVDPQF